MSHYKPYPAYKDSGVEWLGKVPAGWEVSKLGYLSWVRARLGWKGLKAEEYLSEGYALLATPNIKDYEIDFQNVNFISKDRYDESPEIKIRLGDVLLAKDGSTLGTTNIVRKLPIEATVNSSLAVITPQINLNSSFLYFYLKSQFVDSNIQLLKGGMGVPHLFQSDLNRFIFPLPPIDQQKIIAKKLDSETTRIDTLIAKKTRFIELLKEKRQALITQAVTKGLNPNVKMKDSGVEWLGEVPEHWYVKPLKYVSPSLTVGIVVNPSDYVTDKGLPFLYGGDIGEGKINFDTARRITTKDSERNFKTKLMAGDLVTVRVGAPGITAVVPPECEGGNCASVMLIRRGEFNSEWLCFVMNSRIVRYQVEVVQYGAAQEQFNISHAVDFMIPVPPTKEQNTIAHALDLEGQRIDALLWKTQLSITLLKERRSALITAAVTGQIDLREAA